MTDPALADNPVHEPGSTAHRSYQQWVLPIAEGGYGWLTICACGERWSGVTNTFDTAEQQGRAMVDATAAVHLSLKAPKQRNGAKRGFTKILFEALPPVLTGPVEYDPSLRRPGEEFVVAADASHDAFTGRFGWAVVTGAGWVATRAPGEIPGVEPSSSSAELSAVMDAIALFPRHVPITILTDNEQVAAYVQRALDGARGRKVPVWVTPQYAATLGGMAGHGHAVTVQWIPRNSHRLHAAADQFALVAANNAPSPWGGAELNEAARKAVEKVIREAQLDGKASRLAWRAAVTAVAATRSGTEDNELEEER